MIKYYFVLIITSRISAKNFTFLGEINIFLLSQSYLLQCLLKQISVSPKVPHFQRETFAETYLLLVFL